MVGKCCLPDLSWRSSVLSVKQQMSGSDTLLFYIIYYSKR
jgi:hypothetical protein